MKKYSLTPVNQLALYIIVFRVVNCVGVRVVQKVLVLFMCEGYCIGGRIKDSQAKTHFQTTRELHDFNIDLASFDNGFIKL